MKRLIIINPQQLGVNTDYVMYLKYLKPHYDEIKFITVNQGYIKVNVDSINISYVPYCKIVLFSYILFLLFSIFYILCHSGVVMSSNFKGCRYIKMLFPFRKMVVNIRTVSVSANPIYESAHNLRIKNDVLNYDRIVMISEGGAKQLKLPLNKTFIVSLGADVISNKVKSYIDTINLLYVGTLTGRNILQTVIGIKMFLDHANDSFSLTYDIVGDGDEYDQISKYIIENNLSEVVSLHGFVPYDSLSYYFDRCNIGVSFVPIKNCYMYQPPTKTYEYINSGLFCIATDTYANRMVINKNNGCLIQDNAEAFMNAIISFCEKRYSISDQRIRYSGEKYVWKNIVENQLLPVLNF